MDIYISHYRVLKITKRLNLASGYTIKKSKPYKKVYGQNNDCENLVAQNFTVKYPNKIMTSDLTYISVKSKFYYVCFIVDLFNREITSTSISDKHDSKMVLEALQNPVINLFELEIFSQ